MAHGARGCPHSLMEVRLLRVGVGSGHDRPRAEWTAAEQSLKVDRRKAVRHHRTQPTHSSHPPRFPEAAVRMGWRMRAAPKLRGMAEKQVAKFFTPALAR